MAGTQINNYSQSDSNILELQLTSDQSFKGKHLVSLTNYNNTSLPAVAAGSVIEVNGALYKFTSEEVITGSPSDGTVYVYIDPATITAVFTNTSPTWSDSKQGWYGTSGTVNCRYIYILNKASAVYTGKNVINSRIIKREFIASFGSGDANKTINHDISNANTNKRILSINYIAYKSGVLSPSISNVSSVYNINNIYFNDTTIYIDRSTTGTAIDFYITVEYM